MSSLPAHEMLNALIADTSANPPSERIVNALYADYTHVKADLTRITTAVEEYAAQLVRKADDHDCDGRDDGHLFRTIAGELWNILDPTEER